VLPQHLSEDTDRTVVPPRERTVFTHRFARADCCKADLQAGRTVKEEKAAYYPYDDLCCLLFIDRRRLHS